jgi:hypothetical protein
MQGTTKGEDIYCELFSMLHKFSIPLEKIVGISTDGARAMSSLEKGAAGRLFKEIKEKTGREILINHCMIHQENLCAKKLELPHVTVPIIKMINFLKSRALNHRQFRELLKELESEYEDVIYNTEIRWLSKGAMLKRVYDLKTEIQIFLNLKHYDFSYFDDEEWMRDFCFMIDITQHLNVLNVNCKGKINLYII